MCVTKEQDRIYFLLSVTHRLVSPDGVQEGGIVPAANLRQDEGQKARVAIQLGVHEILEVKQVCNDVHSCRRSREDKRLEIVKQEGM